MNYRETLKQLKIESGTHSPSIDTIVSRLPNLQLNVDACFLSNPYATDLFMSHLNHDIIEKNKLKNLLEFYPPQIQSVRKAISSITNINPENIFIGNGATEIIQGILQNFIHVNICVILPTFSCYYEFVPKNIKIFYYQLSKENNFELDLDDYMRFVKENNIKNVILINPNNPNGGYIESNILRKLIQKLSHLDNVILDESFIHFAYENEDLFQVSLESLVMHSENLIVIKSMSKDFGIAGIRAGYCVMDKNKVTHLLETGYLWNVSGLSNYFFQLYSTFSFRQEYDIVRKKYILNTLSFVSDLKKISSLKTYPSKANFVLLELIDGRTSFDYYSELLIGHGVYVRDCSDKKGLNGDYIRVASRTFEENLVTINALRKVSESYNKK